MKKIGLIIIANLLLLPSLAVAGSKNECGVLDFGNDVVWEYKDGSFTDLDGVAIGLAVPSKKKIQVKLTSGAISIEKSVSGRGSNSKAGIKFNIKPKKGKAISSIKTGNDLIGVFEGSADNLNFLLLDVENSSVYRASVTQSALKKKIAFTLDEEAGFYIDDCSSDDEIEDPIEDVE